MTSPHSSNYHAIQSSNRPRLLILYRLKQLVNSKLHINSISFQRIATIFIPLWCRDSGRCLTQSRNRRVPASFDWLQYHDAMSASAIDVATLVAMLHVYCFAAIIAVSLRSGCGLHRHAASHTRASFDSRNVLLNSINVLIIISFINSITIM